MCVCVILGRDRTAFKPSLKRKYFLPLGFGERTLLPLILDVIGSSNRAKTRPLTLMCRRLNKQKLWRIPHYGAFCSGQKGHIKLPALAGLGKCPKQHISKGEALYGKRAGVADDAQLAACFAQCPQSPGFDSQNS